MISIHAPAWGATKALSFFHVSVLNFNPRARVGRDVRPVLMSTSSLKFQSTRPRGARPMHGRLGYASLKFQSTRPRGARPRTYHGCNRVP